jgi:hypothetical protein
VADSLDDYWRFHLRQEHKHIIYRAIYREDLVLAA